VQIGLKYTTLDKNQSIPVFMKLIYSCLVELK